MGVALKLPVLLLSLRVTASGRLVPGLGTLGTRARDLQLYRNLTLPGHVTQRFHVTSICAREVTSTKAKVPLGDPGLQRRCESRAGVARAWSGER
eukprot:354486-Rhodomonas_salina.3